MCKKTLKNYALQLIYMTIIIEMAAPLFLCLCKLSYFISITHQLNIVSPFSICLFCVCRKGKIRRYFYADVEKNNKNRNRNNNLRREMSVNSDNDDSRGSAILKMASSDSGNDEGNTLTSGSESSSTAHVVTAEGYTDGKRGNDDRLVQIPETLYEEGEMRDNSDQLTGKVWAIDGEDTKSTDMVKTSDDEPELERTSGIYSENSTRTEVSMPLDNDERDEKVKTFSHVELGSIASSAANFHLKRRSSFSNASFHAREDAEDARVLHQTTSLEMRGLSGDVQVSSSVRNKREEIFRPNDAKPSRSHVASISQSIESRLSALLKKDVADQVPTVLKKIDHTSRNVMTKGSFERPTLPFTERALERLRMTSDSHPGQSSKGDSDEGDSIYFGSDGEISSLKGEVHSHETPQISTSGEDDGYTVDFTEEDETVYEEYPVNHNDMR